MPYDREGFDDGQDPSDAEDPGYDENGDEISNEDAADALANNHPKSRQPYPGWSSDGAAPGANGPPTTGA